MLMMFSLAYETECSLETVGGNSGIGKQTVAVLAAKGAKVYLGARSHDKYITALGDIHASHPPTKNSNIIFLEVDLSSAASAKASAGRFKLKEERLDLLYNNAGVLGTPQEMLSIDGYEYQWAVNVFGTFVFTYYLIPVLLRTVEVRRPYSVRIINTSSDGAKQACKSGIPLEDKTVGSSATRFQRYGNSKIGTILLTRQLAIRYPTILSLAPHPGPVQSNLTRELGIPRPIMWVLNRVVYRPVQHGALTQLFSGTAPSLTESNNGSYLVPLAKFETRLPHPQCYDDDFGSKVWEWNMEAMKAAGVLDNED
ncbi:NAD(P)-binding protein [Xylaria flabelliformis]|nr:NAD(P)-binding protein [Xylaria flabelliformis]